MSHNYHKFVTIPKWQRRVFYRRNFKRFILVRPVEMLPVGVGQVTAQVPVEIVAQVLTKILFLVKNPYICHKI